MVDNGATPGEKPVMRGSVEVQQVHPLFDGSLSTAAGEDDPAPMRL
jgi:hypothetical protein